jgi:hypothetical protein
VLRIKNEKMWFSTAASVRLESHVGHHGTATVLGPQSPRGASRRRGVTHGPFWLVQFHSEITSVVPKRVRESH